MQTKLRCTISRAGFFAFLALLGALMIFLTAPAGIAFAEGETPPVTEPAESTPAPELPTQEPPVDETGAPPEPAPTETPPAAQQEPPAPQEEPAPTETPPAPADEPAPPPAELPQALDEAGLTLETPVGEPLALAEQQSAEAIANPDPFILIGSTKHYFLWTCPGGLTDPTCTTVDPGINPIQAAIDAIASGAQPMPTDRAIHVEAGTFNSANQLLISAGTNPTLRQLSALLGAGSTQSFIGDNLNISGVTNGFTLRGFTFTEGSMVSFAENSGAIVLEDVVVNVTTGVGGVRVVGGMDTPHNGSVTIRDVTSSGASQPGGAFLVSGAVTITNSAFLGSHSTGLIAKGSSITINGVSASNNENIGADLSATGSITVRNSIFTGNGTVGEVSRPALKIEKTAAGGSITIQNVTLNNNLGSGLQVTSATGAPVILTNNEASDNAGIGIVIGPSSGSSTLKDVTITYLTARRNAAGVSIIATGNVILGNFDISDNITGHGLALDACQENSSTHQCSSAGTVTIRNGTFTNNDLAGVQVFARGAITLTNVDSSENGSSGMWLKNAFIGATGGITITNPAGGYGFDGNNGDGLHLESNGAIKLTNVVASGNSSQGLFINNETSPSRAPVTLSNSSKTQVFYNNSGDGIYLFSKGAVTLTHIYVSLSGGWGVRVNNTYDTASAPVTLTNFGVYSSSAYGLAITSLGAVTLKNGESSLNGDDNISILNMDSGEPYNKPVTLTGVTADNSTNGAGMRIISYGVVTLTNVNASNNGDTGILVDNRHTGNPGVTVVSTGAQGQINANQASGLDITTNGAVVVTNFSVSDNLAGLTIDQTLSTLPRPTTLNRVVASRNDTNGIFIETLGAVTINGFQTNDNGSHGLFIDNCLKDGGLCVGISPVNINSVKGWLNNTASGNDTAGLLLSPGGPTTISVVNLDENIFEGLYLYARDAIVPVHVTLISPVLGSISGNSHHGAVIQTHGKVTIRNFRINDNDGSGLLVNNFGYSTPSPVIMVNVSANGNQESGIEIKSLAAVTLTDVSASNNSATNTTIFSTNTYANVVRPESDPDIFTFHSDGATETIRWESLVNLKVMLYNDAGEYISGSTSDVGSLVQSLSAGFYQLRIYGEKNVGGAYLIGLNVSSLVAPTDLLEYSGIKVDNCEYSTLTGQCSEASPAANVSITYKGATPGAVSYNAGTGIWVRSKGAVTLTNLDASSSFAGINVDNSSGKGGILASRLTANDSLLYGIRLITTGKSSLSDATANNNLNNGIDLMVKGTQPLPITRVTANDNRGLGINVSTFGVITATSLSASNNQDNGAVLSNQAVNGVTTTLFNGVTLLGDNHFNENGNDTTYGSGLIINTRGAISVTNVDASQNYETGLMCKNDFTGSTGKVTITNGAGKGLFEGNGLGLNIQTRGAVVVNNVTSTLSTYGNYIYNFTNTTTPAPVTVTNATFNGTNEDAGLEIYASGAVTLTRVNASNNAFTGIEIDNTTTFVAPVSLTLVTANSNGNSGGIMVNSRGAVMLNGITANDNTGDGVEVNNDATGSTAGITLLGKAGANTFDGNSSIGLQLSSNGPISLTRFGASSNGEEGVAAMSMLGGIKLTDGSTRYNTNDGCSLYADGAVVVNNLNSQLNGLNGLLVSVISDPVSILNSVFSSNTQNGIYLEGGSSTVLTNTLSFGNILKNIRIEP